MTFCNSMEWEVRAGWSLFGRSSGALPVEFSRYQANEREELGLLVELKARFYAEVRRQSRY